MEREIKNALIEAAILVREHAYAPYSKFKVGAAVLARSGAIYTGCNVENASFGLCICAERSAISKAVSQGDRDLLAIAIAASPLASPCGACRQVIFEFGSEIEVISVDPENKHNTQSWLAQELLPDGFRLSKATKTNDP